MKKKIISVILKTRVNAAKGPHTEKVIVIFFFVLKAARIAISPRI